MYDETNPGEDNPHPDGERAGEGIEFKSTSKNTESFWVGHATQTAIAQDPRKWNPMMIVL